MEHILENGNNTWCDKTVHALCFIKSGFKDVQSIPPPEKNNKNPQKQTSKPNKTNK